MTHEERSWAIRARFAIGLGAVTVLSVHLAEAVETTNRLAQNSLTQNRLAQNRLAQNQLADYALSSTRLQASLATAELVSTEEGREVFGYIVSCALPVSQSIEVTVSDAPDTAPPYSLHTCVDGLCTFSGSLGLAPYWADRRLDPKGQRWISSCLLARVNLFVTVEAISLRGLAPELSVGIDEGELYSLAEGAFFGNLFADPDGPLDWNACRGEGQASGEFGGLSLRDCAEEDPANPGFTYCGFNYAGDCIDFTPEFPNPYSCKSFDAEDGSYGDCHASASDGHWPGLRTYREVITSYVSP